MALVAVQTDGSVNVHSGGVEMGQGIQVKQQQIVARVLGIPSRMDTIHINDVDTNVAAGAMSTGADSGTDLNGWATFHACKQIRLRLVQWAKTTPKTILKGFPDGEWWEDPYLWEKNFVALIVAASGNRIDLAAHAYYKTPGSASEDPYWADLKKNHPFSYYTYSAGCVEVEIDVLTGQTNVLQADILFDAGRSLNPMVDLGQVQGAFVQGMGYILTEEMLYNDKGSVLSKNTWEYKPPCSKTIPQIFNATLAETTDVLGSHARRAGAAFHDHEVVVAMHEVGCHHTTDVLQRFGAIAKQIKLEGHTGQKGHNMFVDAVRQDARLQHVNADRLKVSYFDPEESKTQKLMEGAFAALHSAKMVGEPPCVLGAVVLLAIKQAVLAARKDRGEMGWFQLDAPCTPARVHEACLVESADLQI